MEWEDFKVNCEVLPFDESTLIRACFIDEFVDTTCNGYKENIVKINIELLIKGEKFFLEDIYVFDDTLSWYFVKTHEYSKGKKGRRYCLNGGVI